MSIFIGISKDQMSSLEEALALITILIAGADGNIEAKELQWAEKLTHIRSYAEPAELNALYEKVQAGFSAKLAELISVLPSDLEAREAAISDRLAQLNGILPLLENRIAYKMYKSYKSFAKHIAKASGGFLGFGSISREERRWISLSMINPIFLEDEEE